MSTKQISEEIHQRYPDISISRAFKMVRKIKKYGPDTKINWSMKKPWKTSR